MRKSRKSLISGKKLFYTQIVLLIKSFKTIYHCDNGTNNFKLHSSSSTRHKDFHFDLSFLIWRANWVLHLLPPKLLFLMAQLARQPPIVLKVWGSAKQCRQRCLISLILILKMEKKKNSYKKKLFLSQMGFTRRESG